MDLREFAGKKILLIEEDAKLATLIKNAFSGVDSKIFWVKTFEEGAEKFARFDYQYFVFNLNFNHPASVEFLNRVKDRHGDKFQNMVVNTQDVLYSEEYEKAKNQPSFIKKLFEEKGNDK